MSAPRWLAIAVAVAALIALGVIAQDSNAAPITRQDAMTAATRDVGQLARAYHGTGLQGWRIDLCRRSQSQHGHAFLCDYSLWGDGHLDGYPVTGPWTMEGAEIRIQPAGRCRVAVDDGSIYATAPRFYRTCSREGR